MEKEIIDSLFGDEELNEEEHLDSTSPTTNLTEIRPISSVGGNRGLFSLEQIPVGTLVLAEIPWITWGNLKFDDPNSLVEAAQKIIENPPVHEMSRKLFPQQLSLINDENELIRTVDILDSSDLNTQYSKDSSEYHEMQRIILVLFHNAFASGLYSFLSMINHSCHPNCIKFTPTKSSNNASEVWSIRPIAPGEELTICYCESLTLSSTVIQTYLKNHHNFYCTCVRCSDVSFSYRPVVPRSWESLVLDSLSLTPTFPSPTFPSLSVSPSSSSFDLTLDQLWESELESMEEEYRWVSAEAEGRKVSVRTGLELIQAADHMLHEFCGLGSLEPEDGDQARLDNGTDSSAMALPSSYNIYLRARTHKLASDVSLRCIEMMESLPTSVIEQNTLLSAPPSTSNNSNQSSNDDDQSVLLTRRSATNKRRKSPTSHHSLSHIDISQATLSCALSFLTHTCGLLESQQQIFQQGLSPSSPSDHPDLASSHKDLSEAMRGILQRPGYLEGLLQFFNSQTQLRPLDSTNESQFRSMSLKDWRKLMLANIPKQESVFHRIRALYRTAQNYPTARTCLAGLGDLFQGGLPPSHQTES